ncbi:RNA polymerase sigma-70 factor [Ekhidna sp. MALMAid0563]|uniref:RNA polymerase sigma-70 factor n=1 Tax=Ekhidna sp. MALMAid0563 TaxID=3143937 RepID=UPI0032E02A53
MNFSEHDFEALFKEHYPFLCSFARRYVQDVDDSKDIVHNAFLKLWQKQNEIDLSKPLKPYLFKSVHNLCLNYIRDRKKIVKHDLQTDSEAIPAYIESRDYLEESELQNRIVQAIENLPDKTRRIFSLSRFEGKKYREIAEIEGISVKTVEDQMSKALRVLREKLKDYLIIYIFIQLFTGL